MSIYWGNTECVKFPINALIAPALTYLISKVIGIGSGTSWPLAVISLSKMNTDNWCLRTGSTVPYVVERIVGQGPELNKDRVFIPTGSSHLLVFITSTQLNKSWWYIFHLYRLPIKRTYRFFSPQPRRRRSISNSGYNFWWCGWVSAEFLCRRRILN